MGHDVHSIQDLLCKTVVLGFKVALKFKNYNADLLTDLHTECLDPIYILTNKMEWIKISWTHSIPSSSSYSNSPPPSINL